jgi:signal transduction histidine kinase
MPVAVAARTSRAPDGRGVRGMRQRVELLGGAIDIGPTPQGWSVHAQLPLGETAKTFGRCGG